jgi:hypothetical protein
MGANDDLISSINAATVAMASKINVKADAAVLADNSLKLGNKSGTDLVNDAKAAVLDHAGKNNNPHGTTASQANAFTKEEIGVLLNARLPSGLLPLARWASNTEGDGDVAPGFSFSSSPLSVTFLAMTAMINGSQYKVPVLTVVLTPNAVNYMYFKLTAGVPTYVTSPTALAESNTQMFIGTITTTTVVTANTIMPVVRLGLYRISTTRRGASIPVSGGSPVSPQPLNWT